MSSYGQPSWQGPGGGGSMYPQGPTAGQPASGGFAPGAYAGGPQTRVELRLSARKLLDLDVFSKSDPFCVMYQMDPKLGFVEMGRTETIKNSLDPNWNKSFVLDYRFEERQMLKFEVYDSDQSGSLNLRNHEFLGSLTCSLGEIVAESQNKFQRSLGTNRHGSLLILAEEIGECREAATLQFYGQKLDKKDFFGKSDPYLVISKQLDNGTFVPVHKTEYIRNTLNPIWKAFEITETTLCSGNHARPIKFECFDYDEGSSPDFIGHFTTTYGTLRKGPGVDNTYQCINPKKQHKSKYKNSGVILLQSIKFTKLWTFLDFIRSGIQMHFSVAVDFTASNGDPRTTGSLHYINPQGGENQYTAAIRAVGTIIQDYDTDKLFPALGFGALIPPLGQVSHEFFLNGSPDNPYCGGVDGILQAYFNTLNCVRLYGPTNFSPVIQHVARIAQSCQDGRNYFVLLIITDGLISDMLATKMAIVEASYLPMSIIIVGVGNEDFSNMDLLDADGKRLSYQGKLADRDIVQFVEMQRFVSQTGEISQTLLAKEVLAEIPDQLVLYMKKRGFEPLVPQSQPNSVQSPQKFSPHSEPFPSAPP